MLSLLGITPFPRPTPTPHARLLPLPRAVSDWSSITDPLALQSLEVLGESEEEAAAAYNAVNLSASDQESESFGGDGSDADTAERPEVPARRFSNRASKFEGRFSNRASKFEGDMQERGCVERHKRPKAKGHINYRPVVTKPNPTQRMAKRAHNYANYLARKRLVTIDFLARATAAKEKLDVAHTNYYLGKRGWGDAVAADPTQLTSVVKERAFESAMWLSR